jgi:hypothetical protein
MDIVAVLRDAAAIISKGRRIDGMGIGGKEGCTDVIE